MKQLEEKEEGNKNLNKLNDSTAMYEVRYFLDDKLLEEYKNEQNSNEIQNDEEKKILEDQKQQIEIYVDK